MYGPVSRVPTPPWDWSPGSTPFPCICKLLTTFLFARSLQHFWLPASHLLGTCYLLDNLRSTHTPSKYLRATYSYNYKYMSYVSTSFSLHIRIYIHKDLYIHYIYIYIYIQINIYIYTHTYTYTYIHKYIHFVSKKTCIHIYIYMHTYIYKYIDTKIYTYVYLYIYIHTYIYINTAAPGR